MATLTLVGDDWQTVRARMNRIRYDVASEVGRLAWVWHVEPNPRGTGQHVHLWQRGRFIPQATLSRIADRRGCGAVVDIRRWRPKVVGGVSYGVKMTGVVYGVKSMEHMESMSTYLAANGGRIAHATRGFWLDAEGAPTTQRGAMEAWMRQQGAEDPGPWEMIRETQASLTEAQETRWSQERRLVQFLASQHVAPPTASEDSCQAPPESPRLFTD